MNKMKNLLKGSSLVMVVAGLVIAGVVGAAIVSYISNAPTATVTVSSPVKMGIYEGPKNPTYTTGYELIILTPTFGGSSMSFSTLAKNQANNRIGGYYVTVIEATIDGDKMTGKEFKTINYTINETGYTGEDGELIALGKLCVVNVDAEGALTLIKLASTTETVWGKSKMILFYDYDSIDSEPDGNVPACSEFTVISAGETRSFTHLEAGATRTRTFTPTWATGASGNFKISAQYVNDLAEYATEVYGTID